MCNPRGERLASINADASLPSEPSRRSLRIQERLVFAHQRLHEGAPVLSGRKYVPRTVVMFEQVSRPAGGA
jgi:hypothetical protein